MKTEIQLAESVQRTFTRKLCQRANISFIDYNDRLEKLNLESLHSRRIKNDLKLLYKIIHGLVDIQFNNFFKFTSHGGHNLRRHNQQIARHKPSKTLTGQNFFARRVVSVWNSLPSDIVNSASFNIFKSKLQKLSF